MKLNRLGLTTQLTLLSVLLSVLLLGLTGFSIWTINRNNVIAEQVMRRQEERVLPALRMKSIAEANTPRIRAVAMSSEPEMEVMFGGEIVEATKEFVAVLTGIMKLPLNDDERQTLALIKQQSDIAIAAIRAVHQLKAAGKLTEARAELANNFEPAATAFFKDVAAFSDLEQRNAEAMHQEMLNTAQHSIVLEVVLGLLIVLGVSALSIALVKHVRTALGEVSDLAIRIAAGDLTGEIKNARAGELGTLILAMKGMNDNLLKIVGQVRRGTDNIAAASSEIASGNLDLSARTEAQARSLEETALSMENLTSRVKQNADSARHASKLATSASDVAMQGGNVVDQVVRTMSSINDASKKIVDITSVINGIAFQTNILALNAAVEAARAGEQGRGFAVVATEVRNLAQRSAAAAKEIKALIDDSVAQVDAGSKLVQQAGATMTEVVSSVKRVTDIMGEISFASEKQSQGIEQVNEALMAMDNVTQRNSALVEEAAAGTASLQEQAHKLAQVVNVFTLLATERPTSTLAFSTLR